MDPARAVLVADAVGCIGTAVVVLVAPSAIGVVDPSGRARLPVAAALALTATACAIGAATPRPSRTSLAVAAGINAAWVSVCAGVLATKRTSGLGTGIVAATGLLDGLVGSAQWALRSRATGTG